MNMRWMSVSIVAACLSTSAWAAPLTATDKVVNAFMDLDNNHSGSVSQGEYRSMVEQRMNARFREMDANRNGEVTADEYRQFWLAKKAQWYRLER